MAHTGSRYDTNLPRILLLRPDGTGVATEVMDGEAFIFLVCGYTVEVSEWNGKQYVTTKVIAPKVR